METEKLTPFLWRKGEYYLHWCQGCKYGHLYQTDPSRSPSWNFNGDIERPSFSPSMRIYTPAHNDGEFAHPEQTICHYFVTDGQIQYCDDSRHELKGQTLPLEPIPEDYGF